MTTGRDRRRAAVVVAAAAAFLTACTDQGTPSATTPAPAPTVTTAPTTTTTTTTAAARPFPYQPLWPFTDAAQAAEWQESHRTGGHAPWHLDPEATALAFTTDHLGFTGIDQVLATDVDGDEAHVTVGFRVPEAAPGTAAVLHLARLGAGDDAPWEVVGTRDTTLSLTQPRYGAAVSSPITAGGRITGVDESIRVQVLGPGGLLGESCCLPAGGENTPWTTTVTYRGATGTALTVVASTGGHVTDVERFAITGVRPAG
ncbi:hypothetical protein [Actinophytocola sp. KF-1]